jgi:hypothetical protein
MVENIDAKDILRKYGAKIEEQIKVSKTGEFNYSNEYTKFREEAGKDLSRYERLCNSLGRIIKLNISEKDEKKLRKYIEIAHLNIEPWQVLTLSVITFLGIFLFSLLFSSSLAYFKGSISEFPFIFFFLMIIFSVFVFYFMNNYPKRLVNKWRLKASSQMVPAILYVVVYMRHTSNLERAIAFAAENLQEPLSLDFKKVFYDVSIGKFSTIKSSLDNYLESWRDYSVEFVEAFHLIEASLFEIDNHRRISSLEKSIQIILDGVYNKMLKFTHSVRSPLTNVYMLGVVLPTLALALLPLASAMLGGMIQWYHVLILFNLIIPFFIFYLTDQIMSLRPGGYGETELLERNPFYYKYKNNSVYFKSFLICFPLFILSLLPIIFQFTSVPELIGLQKDYSFSDLGLSFLGDSNLFDFKESGIGITGPFGLGAILLSMFFPLSIAIFFSISYKSKTKELIIERENTKQLEDEFNNSLFQLGNRIQSGIPLELSFGKVAESSRGLRTEDFFRRVNYNIRRMGMSVEKAIFNPRRGAINYYPSNLISTSMRILIESSKKGLSVAAISLISISQYIKNIKDITNRLKDLLAEIISDMKSNMTFLAPLLSGVVVGLAAMITSILNHLKIMDLQEVDTGGFGDLGSILNIFDLSKMIPPYYLQIIVGIYLIQVIFILTRTLVSVDSGEDKLERVSKTGKNLIKGIGLYFIVAFFSIIVLFILTLFVLGNLI